MTARDGRSEPIAILGLASRLPGADGLDELWSVLTGGADPISSGAHRWDGRSTCGAFVEGVDEFDAEFFGIGDDEAAAMDPQQRFALELAWHAMEDARLTGPTLPGDGCGVFLSATGSDYAILTDRLAPAAIDRHSYPGTHRSMVANRVSHTLGLRGPSLTVDSGQSSSLVAVHLACESLRNGESDLALAGGVQLNLLSSTTELIEEFGALSPDGRCHVFDRNANGYVRGEGGALVVLKRLADALRDGDPIRCVVNGDAMNNTGAGPQLTAPTAASQMAVITRAHERAGVSPDDVAYLELHGTGTRIGDPVEAEAVGETVGRSRRIGPLPVGSVKSVLGHLEGAAGIAGLVKAVLCLERGQLPPNPGFTTPNPSIDLPALGLEVVQTQVDLDPRNLNAVGVSSFGMGGTNCHVVLGPAPEPSEPAAPVPCSETPLPWILAAADPRALRSLGARVAEVDSDPEALAAALVRTRSPRPRLPYRAVCLGDRGAAATALAVGEEHPDLVVDHDREGSTALVFPGQGSAWIGMATSLLEASGTFAAALGDAADALEPHLEVALRDVLWTPPDDEAFGRADVVQPALWAVMVALSRTWAAAGVEPDVVLGHSQGEIAAATAIGALSLEDGARVVALRSRAIRDLVPGGGMLSVLASPDEVGAALQDEADRTTIAAVNSPRSVLLSGPVEELKQLQTRFTVDGHRARLVPVDYSSHSPAVDPVAEAVRRDLACISPRRVDVPFISSVTGARLDTDALDAEYWFRSLREPVRFHAAVSAALDVGARRFVECSPHPVLTGAVQETAEAAGVDAAVVGTLVRGDGSWRQLQSAQVRVYATGGPVTWDFGDAPTSTLPSLPHYPFQRRRHWVGERSTPVPECHDAPTNLDEALALVRRTVAVVLDRPITMADDDVTYGDLGTDSARALEIRARLRAATGLPLAVGVVFDHPSVARLAAHLVAGATGVSPAAPEPGGGGRPGAHATNGPATDSASAWADDPVVVVGMACRLPGGVDTPEGLWALVADGVDATAGFPQDRGWPLASLASGESSTNRGGFLTGAADFDAGFFGISPREALAMDPQQRLLLTLAWEALERAGVDPTSLQGSTTGVFAGAMAPDYGPPLHASSPSLEGHLLTGSALSVASGRIAYTLGLQGPALTVDTACSSSLVALHLATRALRDGSCDLALAGGATVMATPGMFMEFSRQGGLAPDGRCKAFSANADGTGWAEGAGMLVLERRSAAERGGHPILAVLRGSAIGQDGRSSGLTTPNGPAQEQVIRRALADARLEPHQVAAVEAHGTGTRIGDPIELQALLNTFGEGRPSGDPLRVGSLKSNLGHTQAAAGVAGVIKSVLALMHRTLPATLHAATPTDGVELGDVLRLLENPEDLTEGPVRIGVSSFGISGTNAHVVLEAADPPESDAAPSDGPLAWAFSARTPAALTEVARRLIATAETSEDLPAVGRTLARRSVHEHRAVAIADDRAGLADALQALAEGRSHANVVVGRATARRAPVLVFPGQGSQWAGMTRELLDSSDVFWDAMCRCDGAFAAHIDWSVLDVVRDEQGAPDLELTEVVQPVLFSVMVALAEVWASLGVRPTHVIGHSQGELAAAVVSGVISLDDAARMVAARSRLLAGLGDRGGMTSVSASVQRTTELIDPWDGQLSVAIHSGPESTVVAGDVTALAALEERLRDHVQTRRVGIGYAAHSPQMAEIESALRSAFSGVRTAPGTAAFVSGLTAGVVPAADLDADYWYRALRHPVQLTAAVEAVLDRVDDVAFIECSPHPVLTGAITETARSHGQGPPVVESLRRGGGMDRLLRSVAHAFTVGVPVDWTSVLGTGPLGAAPTYPFEKRRYWVPMTSSGRPGSAQRSDHPLLDAVLPLADGSLIGTATWTAAHLPWIADHSVAGRTIVSGTALIEVLSAIGSGAGADLADAVVEAPVPVPDSPAPLELQVRVGPPEDSGAREVVLSTQVDGSWTRHVVGTMLPRQEPDSAEEQVSWPPTGAETLSMADLYADLAAVGYAYGPAFQGVQAAWRLEDGYAVEVDLPDGLSADGYLVHPVVLDAALHPLVRDLADGSTYVVPIQVGPVNRGRPVGQRALVRLRVDGDRVTLEVHDSARRLVARVGLVLARVSGARLAGGVSQSRLRRQEWERAEGVADPTTWAVLGAEDVVEELGAVDVPAALHFDLPSLADLSYGPIAGAVLAPVPAEGDDLDDIRAALSAVRELVQTWLVDERFADSTLVVATGPSLAGAAVVGMLRSAITEHPGRFAIVQHDDETRAWAAVARAVAAGRPEIRVVEGAALAPVVRDLGSDPGAEPARLDPDRSVLITGGTGHLGRLVAEHLAARHGLRHLVLASRAGGDSDLREWAASLPSVPSVTTVAADLGSPDGVRAALAAVPADHPLGAVIHLAGERADGAVDRISDADVDRALAGKVGGALALDAALADLDVSHLVLFSSVAATVGSPGQGAYAAANSVLLALADRRHRRGLPATAVAWGLWDTGGGMATGLAEADRRRLDRAGVPTLSAEDGLSLLDQVLETSSPTLIVTGAPKTEPTKQQTQQQTAPLPSASVSVPAARLSSHADVIDLVRLEVATVLGHAGPGDVALTQELGELGLDSIAVVDLRNRLEAATGLRLPPTLAFDHPTVTALGDHLAASLLDEAASDAPGSPDVADVLAAARRRTDGDTAARRALGDLLRHEIAALEDRSLSTEAAGISAASDHELFEYLDQSDEARERTAP